MKKVEKSTRSRRTFLQASAVALVGTCLPRQAKATANQMCLAMIIDLSRCIGCQSCVLACKGVHDNPQKFRTWIAIGEQADKPAATFTPLQCNHCSPAQCVEACETKALSYADNGTVRLDAQQCLGCGFCVSACSYESINIDSITKKADKCDFCMELNTPACVEACASHARLFGDMANPTGDFAKALENPSLCAIDGNSTEHVQVFYIPLKA